MCAGGEEGGDECEGEAGECVLEVRREGDECVLEVRREGMSVGGVKGKQESVCWR